MIYPKSKISSQHYPTLPTNGSRYPTAQQITNAAYPATTAYPAGPQITGYAAAPPISGFNNLGGTRGPPGGADEWNHQGKPVLISGLWAFFSIP